MHRAAAAPRPLLGQPAHPANPSSPQAGDKVVYSKYAGTELEVQGGNYVLLKVRRRWKLPDRARRCRCRLEGPLLSSACFAALYAMRCSVQGSRTCREERRSNVQCTTMCPVAAPWSRATSGSRWHLITPGSMPALAHLLCPACCGWMQEDDVIGLLPGGDDIAKLQPLQVRGACACEEHVLLLVGQLQCGWLACM